MLEDSYSVVSGQRRQPLVAVCSFFSVGINITELGIFCSQQESILESFLSSQISNGPQLQFRMVYHLIA